MIVIWIVRILQASALLLCFAGVLTNRRLEKWQEEMEMHNAMPNEVKKTTGWMTSQMQRRREVKRLRDLRDLFLGTGLMCFLVSLPPLY